MFIKILGNSQKVVSNLLNLANLKISWIAINLRSFDYKIGKLYLFVGLFEESMQVLKALILKVKYWLKLLFFYELRIKNKWRFFNFKTKKSNNLK